MDNITQRLRDELFNLDQESYILSDRCEALIRLLLQTEPRLYDVVDLARRYESSRISLTKTRVKVRELIAEYDGEANNDHA